MQIYNLKQICAYKSNNYVLFCIKHSYNVREIYFSSKNRQT